MDRFIFKIRKETDKVQSNESANSTAVTPESSVTNLQEDDDNSIGACSSCDQQQKTFTSESQVSTLEEDNADTTDGACSSTCDQQETSLSHYSKLPNVASDDPACEIPKNRLERQLRISRGPFQPRMSMYPRSKIGSKQRSFHSDWFEKFKWLEYSPSKDSAFCFYCRFFPSKDATSKGHTDSAFINKGFKNWHRANECFRHHQLSKSHAFSHASWTSFNKEKSVDVLLDEGKETYLSKQEELRCHNRSVMERLIDIVLCLAKGGRPFRGHNEKCDSLEKGLFLSLVNMLQKYDPLMAKHAKESPRNATYLSNRIQNDLIVAIHNVVLQNIMSSLNGKVLSIIADDTTDCGHHEQMSIVVRYFDNLKNSAVEIFLSVQRLFTVDAQSIFNQLNEVLGNLQIEWSSVLAVCFDGASTMSGCTTGVQMKCKEKNSDILYVHCYAHCLNLILVDACTSSKQNRTVFDFFGIIQTLYNFMEGSSVRHARMEKICQAVGSQLKTLKSLSNTRWACRAEAVAAVKQNYSIILIALEEIIQETRLPDIKIKARGLICELKSFDFIFGLHMMHPILQMVVKVSKALQDPELNLLTAMAGVKSLRNSLVTMRNDPEHFQSIYQESVSACVEKDISIPSVRKRRISTRIDDAFESQHHFNTKEEQERITSFYPLLDSMIAGIDQRFEQETCALITAMGNLLRLTIDRDDIEIIANKFKMSKDELEAEVKLLQGYDTCVSKECTTNTTRQWLDWLKESHRFSMFPAFYKAIQYFAVLPVTSCSCERAFSKLGHVKTKLRSTMSQQRLNSLMLLYIEQELALAVNYNEVIEEFKTLTDGERRLIL